MTIPGVLRLAFLLLALAAPGALPAQPAPAASGEAAAAAPTETEAARALLEVLKDDAARAALIERLEAATDGPAEAAAPPAPPPLGRRIAEMTASAVDGAAASASALWAQLMRAPSSFDRLSAAEIELLLGALRDLALLIVATTALYLGLRRWSRRVFRRLGAEAAGAGALRLALLILAGAAVDALLVAAVWAAGYVAALAFAGPSGTVGVREALYLNAFLVTGLAKVLIRAVLSPAARELRLLAVPDRGARSLSLWLGVIASLLGYGQLLVAPVVAAELGRPAGAAASTALALVAVLIAIGLVLRGRRAVAAWLIAAPGGGERGGLARLLAANWHLPVLIWLLAIAAIVTTRPDGVIWPALTRSAEVALALVAGFVVSGLLTRAAARGVALPETLRLRLPMLERRLNAFVPTALKVARAAIVLAVAGFALDAAGLLDLGGWLSGERGGRVASALVSAALILALTFAIWVAVASWIDYRLNPDYGSVPTSRERTLLALLRNAAAVAIMVFAAMFTLSELGVNIAPLIASAGVFGLAIGFGAQKLVQDVITGIFIQLENAMNVGDVVALNGTTGTVERLTIRSVSLRDGEGCFHIIPFSSVAMVSNFTRDFGYFVADMGVAYREDPGEAKQAMFDAYDELLKIPEHRRSILEPLQWLGLQNLTDSAVVLRARIKCAPGAQWGIGRAYNEIVKRIFDERGIEIPFPHQTIYFGVDKNGEAPPLRIHADPPPASGEAKPEEGQRPVP